MMSFKYIISLLIIILYFASKSSCLEIYSYSQNKLDITINGDGFTEFSKVYFQVENGESPLIVEQSYLFNDSKIIIITIPQTLTSCNFTVVNKRFTIIEESNQLFLEIDMTPIIINAQTSLSKTTTTTTTTNETILTIYYFGNYLWQPFNNINYTITISIDNGITFIDCLNISQVINLTNQYIQCKVLIPTPIDDDDDDDDMIIRNEILSNIKIENYEIIQFKFNQSIPHLVQITQVFQMYFKIEGKGLSNSIKLLNEPISIYWNKESDYNNEIDIALDCDIDDNIEYNLIFCRFNNKLLLELKLNETVFIRVKKYGIISNELTLNIKPIINIGIESENKIKIYPIGDQNITINGYYFINNEEEITTTTTTTTTNLSILIYISSKETFCENAKLINKTEITCTLPSDFSMDFTILKITINGISSDEISPFQYLIPKIESSNYIDSSDGGGGGGGGGGGVSSIIINGNNLIKDATVKFSNTILICENVIKGYSIKCYFPTTTITTTDTFLTCAQIIYSDRKYSLVYQYYAAEIYSLNFKSDENEDDENFNTCDDNLSKNYLIINATLRCEAITPDQYMNSNIYIDADNYSQSSLLEFKNGLFYFIFPNCKIPQKNDEFYFSFKFKETGLALYKYRIIEPTIKTISVDNNNNNEPASAGRLIIDGFDLSKTTKFKYNSIQLKCDSETICYLPNSSEECIKINENDTSCGRDNCGYIDYYGSFYSGRIMYFIRPLVKFLKVDGKLIEIEVETMQCTLKGKEFYENSTGIITDVINDTSERYPLLSFDSGSNSNNNNNILNFKFQFNSKPLQSNGIFNIYFTFFNVKSNNSYFINLPNQIIQNINFINNQFLITGLNLSLSSNITYLNNKLNCINNNNYNNDNNNTIYTMICNNSNLNENVINKCGLINYVGDIFTNVNYRFLVKPIIYDVRIGKENFQDENGNFENNFYISKIYINGSLNCNEISIDSYSSLNLLSKLDVTSIPFSHFLLSSSNNNNNNFEKNGLFIFNFIERKIRINKSIYKLSFSLGGFGGISSNEIIINENQFIDETDYSKNNNQLNLTITNSLNNNNINLIFFLILILLIF
ncbi:hypothetical protein ACTFIY_009795 [Dictyostelium cf. discoideum]